MNIESIVNKINTFDELVINSGFRRDVSDYIQAVQQPQNQNLIFMKGISERVQKIFVNFENNSLPSELSIVLKDTLPFTEKGFDEQLADLDSNLEIDGNSYFLRLNAILNDLGSSIDQNIGEINILKSIFIKYISEDYESEEGEDKALISLVFKDMKSTGTILEFSKALKRWNQILLQFHQLMKSESPKEVSLVEIQNGSIDVILNIDIDVAIDLADVINTGLKIYAAYLLYKTGLAQKTINSFAIFANEELLELEKRKEQLMLTSIKGSMKDRILSLHKQHIKKDSKIDKTSFEKKAEEVSEVLTDHIINGNELKLLTPPTVDQDDEDEGSQQQVDIATELKQNAALVRENSKKLLPDDRKLLLETYKLRDDNGSAK